MRIHQIKGLIQEVYLIEYPDKLLLLDSGSRSDVPKILTFIKETLGRKITDLKLVLVSHMHPDHAGGAGKLRRLTGCKVATAKANKHWYGGFSGFANFCIDIYLTHTVLDKMKKKHELVMFNPYLTADILLVDRDTLPNFPDWQVLQTAGHTDRDLTFYHKKTATAYTGDLIIRTRRGFISPFPISYPVAYRQSLARLNKLNISHFLLAHGGQTAVPSEEIITLIDKTADTPLNNKSLMNKAIEKQKRKISGLLGV